MISSMKEKISEKMRKLKIRTQLLVLIICCASISLILFEVLWLNKWVVCDYIAGMDYFKEQSLGSDFWEKLQTEAQNYNVPSSENDKKAVKAIEPFLDLGDKYTGIYIYGLEDGDYKAGKVPAVFDNATFRTLFDLGYQLTGGEGEETYEFPMKFKNGYATVMVWFYHRVRFIYPYGIGSLALSIFVFFAGIIFFVKKKMNSVIIIKDEILRMAAGNLDDSVQNLGEDEIGIIANELDNLRTSFRDTLSREKESREANQDLITAMSHDLRTPLTILNGYLEVLRLNKNPEKAEEYLNRCLKKTGDIREMTDRMFEYALVFDEEKPASAVSVPVEVLRQCLDENCDFIRLAGFKTERKHPLYSGSVKGEEAAIKRIFNNLFSNILKYGDKAVPVKIESYLEPDFYILKLSNEIKKDNIRVESNRIGLKSVGKMMQQLEGESSYCEEGSLFTVELKFGR